MDSMFMFGLGATVFFPFLQYAVKDMHLSITYSGLFIGVLLMAWAIVPENYKQHLFILGGCLIGGFIAWGIYTAFIGNSKQTNNSLNGSISIDCAHILLPRTVPVEGIINTIQLHPQGGIGTRIGEPGTKWEWLEKERQNGYRCRIRNYGKDVVSQLTLKFMAYFRENIKEENATRSGEVKEQREYKLVIPILNADANNYYEFYVYNGTSYWAQMALPDSVKLRKMGEEQEIDVKLTNSSSFRGFPMTLPPVVWPMHVASPVTIPKETAKKSKKQ